MSETSSGSPDSSREAASDAPKANESRNPLEQREERRERRTKNTLIWRELAIIAALGVVILAFNLNWGNPENDRNVAARDHDEIRLRDVRVTPPEPEPPEPEPEPEPQRRPEPTPEVPNEMPREEVPDEEVQDELEMTDEPVLEPIEPVDPVEDAEPAPSPPPSNPAPEPSPPPAPDPNKVFSQGTADENARMNGTLRPQYPQRARDARVTGRVILGFVVNKQGRAENIEVLRSPHDMLSDAAVSALRDMTFQPAMQNGQPVRMRMSQPVVFQLN